MTCGREFSSQYNLRNTENKIKTNEMEINKTQKYTKFEF